MYIIQIKKETVVETCCYMSTVSYIRNPVRGQCCPFNNERIANVVEIADMSPLINGQRGRLNMRFIALTVGLVHYVLQNVRNTSIILHYTRNIP